MTWAPAFLFSLFCDLSETLASGLQELRVAVDAFQKQLLAVTEVANEDVQCQSLNYNSVLPAYTEGTQSSSLLNRQGTLQRMYSLAPTETNFFSSAQLWDSYTLSTQCCMSFNLPHTPPILCPPIFPPFLLSLLSTLCTRQGGLVAEPSISATA